MKVDGWSSAALDDLGLDVYAFRAYHAIVRRAGVDSTCYEAVGNMARRCAMSERRMQMALRELERRGLVERVARAGATSVYRVLTPEATPAPDAPRHVVPPPPAPDAGVPPHLMHPTPAPDAPEGLDLEGLPLKEGLKGGTQRTVGGAQAAAPPPTERAHTSSRNELDIDLDPPRVPPAPDAVDMDPRLHAENALMDRLNGKPTAMQTERDARSFFTNLLGARGAKNPQVQPRMRQWYEQHGREHIESVWLEAQNAQDPQNARKSPLYYLIDALNGQFTPRAAAARSRKPAAATRIPDGIIQGQPVLLDGEQHVLEGISGPWALLEGVRESVPLSALQPVLEVRS